MSSIGVPEEGDAGGLPVQKDAAADGADLTSREEARQGDDWSVQTELFARLGLLLAWRKARESGSEHGGIVMRGIEEPPASTVAREHDRTDGRPLESLKVKQHLEVFGRGRGVADMKLDGLADPEEVGDGERLAVFVDPEDVSDEEIVASEAVFVLVDDTAHEQSSLTEFAVVFVEGFDGVHESLERRPPAK